MKSLRTALIVGGAVWVWGATGMPTSAPAGAVVAAAQGASAKIQTDRERFVGTYSLVQTEVKDDNGNWTRTPNFNSIGYITYSELGYMGVHIMPKIRARFAGAQPTPEEAQQTLRGYTAYFGTFTVNDKEKFVVHQRLGQIDPGGEVDAKRFYDFVSDARGGERLILTPAPAQGGKEQARNRLIWERQPNAPLSAEARKFVGFYKLLYTDTLRMKDGKEVFHGDKNYTRAGTSWIIYTPTGHMMVHLMNREGRAKYAGAQPTPEEALAAYRSYTGYFGRFVTYENQMPRFVIHSQQGTLQPGGYSDQKRFYQFTGDVLRLGGPPTVNDQGEVVYGHLYWERLPPVNASPVAQSK